jgi:putative membrane protein
VAPVVSGPNSATNNAVNTAPANNGGAPVPGANSFTEGEARSRIQDKGFTQVTDLSLDSQGIWRGKGMKNGQSVDVAMDYQGNVVPQ